MMPGRRLVSIVLLGYDRSQYLRRAFESTLAQSYREIEVVIADDGKLHAGVLRRATDAEAGKWRTLNVGPFENGMVPPGASLVPRQMTTVVDRLASGPPPAFRRWYGSPTPRALHAGAPVPQRKRTHQPAGICCFGGWRCRRLWSAGRAVARYRAALERAHASDPRPLAVVLRSAILASLPRFVAAKDSGGALRKLASFTTGAELGALYKAAQRGRLLAVRRDVALFTREAESPLTVHRIEIALARNELRPDPAIARESIKSHLA